MTSYSQQVVRSFLWQGGAQAAGQVVTWLSTILVIRFLAPADYGLMAMASVFLGLFFPLADLGFGSAAVQAQTLDREQQRRILGTVMLTNLVGSAALFAGAPLVAAFFGEPRLIILVRVLSLQFLLLATYVLPQAHVVRAMEFRTQASINVASMMSAAVVALVLAATGFGVWALVGGVLLSQVVKAVAYNVARPMALTPAFSWSTITRLAQFGALITFDRLLFFLYGQVDVAIGGRVLGKEAVGLYAVALSLAVIPMEKVLPVITQVSFAAFSRIQEERERVRRNVLRSVQLVSMVCLPAFLGMAVIADELLPTVLGPRWGELVLRFQLLCLVLPFKALNALFPPAIFAIGRPGLNVSNTAIALVIMTVALLVGVRYGVTGMCLAWVVAYPIVFAITSWRSLNVLDIRYADFLDRCAFPVAASIGMSATVLWLSYAIEPLDTPVARLTILVSSGVVLYAVFLFVFKRGTVRELLAVARS